MYRRVLAGASGEGRREKGERVSSWAVVLVAGRMKWALFEGAFPVALAWRKEWMGEVFLGMRDSSLPALLRRILALFYSGLWQLLSQIVKQGKAYVGAQAFFSRRSVS